MVRSEALKLAQKRYRIKNKQKIQEQRKPYNTQYHKNRDCEEYRETRREYYRQNRNYINGKQKDDYHNAIIKMFESDY